MVIPSTFVDVSSWSGGEQDDTLEFQGSPRQTRQRGSAEDTSATILYSRDYSFRWGEPTL
jgi:hypothetical protein